MLNTGQILKFRVLKKAGKEIYRFLGQFKGFENIEFLISDALSFQDF